MRHLWACSYGTAQYHFPMVDDSIARHSRALKKLEKLKEDNRFGPARVRARSERVIVSLGFARISLVWMTHSGVLIGILQKCALRLGHVAKYVIALRLLWLRRVGPL